MTKEQTPTPSNLDDLQAFPLLTSEVNQVGIPRTSTVGGTASVGQLAEMALREVLAIHPMATDPTGFVAALNNAFSVTELDGRPVWSWTPRSYAVQADMGAVTGAQASIYSRAKAALDHAVPLLNGLFPLRADADIEDVNSLRAIVRSSIVELINELGTVGGPRPQRVESIFDALLGQNFTQVDSEEASDTLRTVREALLRGNSNQSSDEISGVLAKVRTALHGPHFSADDPEQVSGLLGSISTRFGLERVRVNTIDEEQNLTNYFILVDHVIALKLSWNAQRHYFDGRGNDVFLGTQLVLLSRSLAVIAESVREAEYIMDSVFLGPAERQTIRLRFESRGRNQLTIDELLSWVERFAMEEGPRIIREAGKDGVESLRPTVSRLHELVDKAWRISLRPSSNPTRGFHTPRVQRAMEELKVHLERAESLIDQIRRQPRPLVKFVEANHGTIGSSVRLSVDGENFQRGLIVVRLFDDGSGDTLDGRDVTVVSDTSLRVTFDLDVNTDKAGSVWTLGVINPDGLNGNLNGAFTMDKPAALLAPAPAPVSAPPSQPTRPIPAPRSEGLQVGMRIEFEDVDGDIAARSVRLQQGNRTLNFNESQHIGTLRIIFSRPLSKELVATGTIDADEEWSCCVLRKDESDNPVRRTIRFDKDDPNILEFTLLDRAFLTEGTYLLTLSSKENAAGSAPPLTDQDGNGFDGGQVELKFIINDR